MVEDVDAAGLAHARVQARHFVLPEGVQVIGVFGQELAILPQAIEEAFRIRLGLEELLLTKGSDKALDAKNLGCRFVSRRICFLLSLVNLGADRRLGLGELVES